MAYIVSSKQEMFRCVNKYRAPLVNGATGHGDVRKRGGIAPNILNFGTKWRRILSHIPADLHPSKNPPTPVR